MSAEEIKKLLSYIPNPIVLVGACKGTEHDITTVSWISKTSNDPALIGIFVSPKRYIHSLIEDTDEFLVSVLVEGQEDISFVCGTDSGKYEDKIKSLHLKTSPAQFIHVPHLVQASVNIECKVVDQYSIGDHTLFVGQVIGGESSLATQDKTPLILYQSKPASVKL